MTYGMRAYEAQPGKRLSLWDCEDFSHRGRLAQAEEWQAFSPL